MTAILAAWAATVSVFLAIDAVWLGVIASGFYRRALGDLMLDKPKLEIAVLFYLLYALAIVVLAALPAARSGSWLGAAGLGALLGLAAYGTYDITNLSTLKNWPLYMSLVDMVWGTALTAVAAVAGFAVLRWWGA